MSSSFVYANTCIHRVHFSPLVFIYSFILKAFLVIGIVASTKDISRTYDMTLKGLNWSSWIIWVNPKSNDRCSFKAQKRRERERSEEKALWTWKQRLELLKHKPRNSRNHQKLKEANKDSLLEPSERMAWFSASGL